MVYSSTSSTILIPLVDVFVPEFFYIVIIKLFLLYLTLAFVITLLGFDPCGTNIYTFLCEQATANILITNNALASFVSS